MEEVNIVRIRKIIIVVLIIVLGISFVVLYNKKTPETTLVELTPINDEIKEKIILPATKSVEKLTENELILLCDNSSPLPWSSDSDFSKFHILDSMAATDDIKTNVQLALNKEYKLEETNSQNYYYQMVTTDNDVILIPKSEDCNYVEKKDSVIFNTITSECVKDIFRLRMYRKAQRKDFKILDYSITESQIAIEVIYYTANVNDNKLIISKVIDSVSKGNGCLDTKIESIATIQK
jgi:hypothetical protein